MVVQTMSPVAVVIFLILGALPFCVVGLVLIGIIFIVLKYFKASNENAQKMFLKYGLKYSKSDFNIGGSISDYYEKWDGEIDGKAFEARKIFDNYLVYKGDFGKKIYSVSEKKYMGDKKYYNPFYLRMTMTIPKKDFELDLSTVYRIYEETVKTIPNYQNPQVNVIDRNGIISLGSPYDEILALKTSNELNAKQIVNPYLQQLFDMCKVSGIFSVPEFRRLKIIGNEGKMMLEVDAGINEQQLDNDIKMLLKMAGEINKL